MVDHIVRELGNGFEVQIEQIKPGRAGGEAFLFKIKGPGIPFTYKLEFSGELLQSSFEQGGFRTVEELLFEHTRDLFCGFDMVFFDTTSIYFEGEGGNLGERGNSKDHRPDLKQMVVGVVLDSEGRPICCEMWPGNTTDVKTLAPVVNRLRRRFGIGKICIVPDRGMISAKTVAELERPGYEVTYILGARMRKQKEVRSGVLTRGGRYAEVYPPTSTRRGPAPLRVKEVTFRGGET